MLGKLCLGVLEFTLRHLENSRADTSACFNAPRSRGMLPGSHARVHVRLGVLGDIKVNLSDASKRTAHRRVRFSSKHLSTLEMSSLPSAI